MIAFGSGHNKIVFKIENLPNDTVYDYGSRTIKTYLLKEIEVVFYSSEYNFAGQIALVSSTGFKKSGLSDYISGYNYNRNGIKIFEWDCA